MKNLFDDISEKTKSAVSDLTTTIASTAVSAIDFGDKAVISVKQVGADLSKGIGQVTDEIGVVAGAALTDSANFAGRTLSTIAISAFDQNGDGQIDQEDVKIATEKCVSALKEVSKEIASSNLVKETATAAAVGAAIAIPVPLIGPVTGAVVGATLGAYKHFTKK
jgi:hypothetical protein